MDFGLSGITKALNLPMPGKRRVEQNKATDMNFTQEKHNVKRGRFEGSSTNDDDIAARVVDHPYQEQ